MTLLLTPSSLNDTAGRERSGVVQITCGACGAGLVVGMPTNRIRRLMARLDEAHKCLEPSDFSVAAPLPPAAAPVEPFSPYTGHRLDCFAYETVDEADCTCGGS